jgi:hypothetical protein
MRTTAKHHAAVTVKRTVPYKDFCIFFINWGMATDMGVLQFHSAYTRAATVVEEGIACSNLYEEYCEIFQLIFVLLFISCEYFFISYFTLKISHASWLYRFTVAQWYKFGIGISLENYKNISS